MKNVIEADIGKIILCHYNTSIVHIGLEAHNYCGVFIGSSVGVAVCVGRGVNMAVGVRDG